MKIKINGFTLIEVLTAMAISTVVMAALASTLMGAFQVVHVLDARKKAVLENSLIGLEKMARELQSSPVVPTVPFQGSKEKISFPKLFSAGKDGLNKEFRLGQIQEATVGGGAFTYGKVSYYFDASRKRLVRQGESGKEEVMIEHIQDFKFSYALQSLDDLSWSWESETPPTDARSRIGAVQVTLTFDPTVCRYTIPGIERRLILVRRHPVAAMIEKQDKEAAPDV